MEKLVSILTPCYNGAKYIERYAKSLLGQDYCNCQLIFMNDGSTDNSEKQILSYKDAFEKKGFIFEYHKHNNVGLGGTIAKGVKHVKGDYLIWPDVDDILTPDSISKKVQYLEKRPEVGIVRTRYRKLFEDQNNDMTIIGPTFNFDPTKEELFEDYLLSRNCWLQPGCFMIRMSAFDDANPDRYIYPTRRGQDWQMLLPVLYKYKCGFIDEPLYIYAIHSDSMSNTNNDNYEIEIKRIDMYEELILATISHMDIPEYNELEKKVKVKYYGDRIDIAFKYHKKKGAKMYYTQLKSLIKPTLGQKIKTLFAGNNIVHLILDYKYHNY